MKILFLCHRLPLPPNRGGRIRPLHILKHLSCDHEVTIASLLRADDAAEASEQLRELSTRQILAPVSEIGCWLRAVATVPTPTPASFAYFHSSRLAALVRRALADSYDLIFAHAACMAYYVDGAHAPFILDFGDMDSQKWLEYGRRKPFPAALVYRLEQRKVRRSEIKLAARADLSTCVTRAELETLRSYGVARHTGWFPNGVDAEYFQPSAAPYDRDAICFLGRMDYYPNEDAMRWFCDAVFPQVQAQRPGVRLTIVGASPSRAVLRLGERPGIRVTGTVPDVRPHAGRAAVSVAPLNIARGTQNKILESLAMGVPVVASPLAARGTDTVAGEHLLTARDAREFAAAVVRVMDDPQERTRLALAGRQRVLTHHSWAASMQRLDGLIAECLARRGQ